MDANYALPRIRSRYVIRGKTWTLKWLETKNEAKYLADVNWTLHEIQIDARLRDAKPGTYKWHCLHRLLRHELLQAILERASDAEPKPHKAWTLRHDPLADLTIRLDKLLRTGTDDGWRPAPVAT